MTQLANPQSHPLVERITRLRLRVRMVLALFGIGVLLAAGVAALFLLISGDYLLHFPRGLRIALLLAWVVMLADLSWRFLITPLMTRLTDQFLASRVERFHRGLGDELISAVHFIHNGTGRSNAFAARHIDAATQRAATLPFEEAIDFRRSARALAIAALVIIGVSIIAGLNPQLAKIGIARWFSASSLDWPHITRVLFTWDTTDGLAPKVLPVGEQLLVRARVSQGAYANQRVWLTNWSDTRHSVDDLMTFQPGMSSTSDYVYERTLEPEGDKTLSLKLAAGDDNEQEPVTIRLAPRPIISEMFATLAPPPYVKAEGGASGVVVDLLTQAGRAVEGGRVTIRIKATKPFATDAHGQPLVRLLDQNKDEELALGATRKLLEPNVAEISFAAAKSVQARAAMRDADGFENRVGGTLAIEVVPDALPSVVITEPRRAVDRTPTAHVAISVQATDDLGLDGLKLVAEKFDAKPGDPPILDAPLSWAQRSIDPSSGNVTGRSEYIWDLAAMNLQPGARLTFYAMVQDNYDLAGKRHPWVKSPSLTLQIRSEADIADAARRHLNEIKERIKGIRAQQEQTRSQTEAIQKAAAASGITTPQQKEQLGSFAQQQSEEAASANAVQQTTEHINADLKENNLGESELGKLAADVSAGMKDVGQNNMPAAASELNKAHEAAGNADKNADQAKQQAKEAAAAAANATAQQGEAVAKMNAMIDRLGAAGDFEAIRSDLRKIIDKQNDVNNKTRELATQTIGKRPEDLPQDTRNKLNDLATQQKDLSARTAELIARMDKSATQLRQTDPASSSSLDNASQAGKEGQVAPAQGSASDAVGKNQMQDAGTSQSQAIAGLQKMQSELDKNDQRQLEQLARDLQELLDQVKALRAVQDAINKDTIAAGDKSQGAPLTKLGDRQGQLQMNTIVVQKKAENTKKAEAAALDIHEAADHMSDSAAAMYASHQPASLDPETKALASLDAAIKKLEQEKQKVDDQLKDKDLAYFVAQYEAMRAEQTTVKTIGDAVDKRRQAAVDKQIDRLGLQQVSGLAGREGKLIDALAGISADDKLKDFAVVLWMNTLIKESMALSQKDLKKADLGPELASAEKNALDRLQDIIDALKEEQQRKNDFQNESGGGGNGGQKPPLVPPLAQLKLLKAMQVVINSQTTDVSKSIADASDPSTKATLESKASDLGKKQGEIKDIAHQLIEKLKQ